MISCVHVLTKRHTDYIIIEWADTHSCERIRAYVSSFHLLKYHLLGLHCKLTELPFRHKKIKDKDDGFPTGIPVKKTLS